LSVFPRGGGVGTVNHLDLGALAKFVKPIDHDALTRLQALQDNGVLTGDNPSADFGDADCLVRGQGVDIAARFAELYGHRRYGDGIVLGAKLQVNIDKLVGEQLLLFIGKLGLQIHRAGAGVELVVDGQQHSFG